LPAATQWGLAKRAATWLWPAYEEFIRQAAQGEVVHNDDTGMRILRLTREPTPKGKTERTGVFTSGIVSRVGVWLIALFFSGWKHAGENLAEVLQRREPGLGPLIQMCDALSRNAPKLSEGVRLLLAYCLAHGRRQFVDVAANFPTECRYVLETLGGVWYNDELARKGKWSAQERLRFNQEHRTRDSEGTDPGRTGSCAAEREATGPASHRSRTRCGDPEPAPCWHQQVRDCPPPEHQPDLGSSDFGLTYFPEK
jgi:hypothetical protein